MGAGDVDDAPMPARLHPRHDGAGGVKGRGQVDRDDRVPFAGREILDLLDILDARIVHEDIDLPEGLRRALDQGGAILGLRHIRTDIAHFGPGFGGQCFGHAARFVGMGMIVDDDLAALLRENLRDPEADAAGRAGHDGHFALEHGKFLSIALSFCFGAFSELGSEATTLTLENALCAGILHRNIKGERAILPPLPPAHRAGHRPPDPAPPSCPY